MSVANLEAPPETYCTIEYLAKYSIVQYTLGRGVFLGG
jgi:hypothetical protein